MREVWLTNRTPLALWVSHAMDLREANVWKACWNYGDEGTQGRADLERVEEKWRGNEGGVMEEGKGRSSDRKEHSE